MRHALLTAILLPLVAFAEKEPGLLATFSAGGKSDTRIQRLPAFYIQKGSPATPFLPAGPFKAKIEGILDSPLRAEHTFMVEVRGQVKVSINGELILDAAGAAAAQYADKTVQLKKGANPVVFEFSSDGADDALLRFDWAGADFPREAVPPQAWTHEGAAADTQVREGRMLFATRHCAKCHDDAGALPKDGTGMPELLAGAPDLLNAGARFQTAWLAAWSAAPRDTRRDATMPHLGLTKEQAADVAAFLTTLGKPANEKDQPVDDTVLAQGAALYGNLGCIACHTTPDATAPDADHGRIPLGHVKAKFHPAALREFLHFPSLHNPWTRMPNFRLEPAEVAALSAYLLTNAQGTFPPVKGDAVRGKKIATEQCTNCHQLPDAAPKLTAPKLTALASADAKGCLSEKPEKAPDFGFTPAQRAALAAFLKTDLASLKHDTFAEYAERQIAHLNCTACHPRDGRQSTFQLIEGELATLTAGAPQPLEPTESSTVPPTAIPHLTWLGEKMNPGWAGAFIAAGAAPTKPRPWLASRMPSFGGSGGGIASGLSHQHGLPLTDHPEPAPDKDLAVAGQKLLGADGGFNCTQCHAVKDQPATAVFEAPGPNLATTHDRLRKGYYHRWLIAPGRIDPDTKMPRFSEDGKTTQLTETLDGKAREQFEAIWQYLKTVK